MDARDVLYFIRRTECIAPSALLLRTKEVEDVDTNYKIGPILTLPSTSLLRARLLLARVVAI